MASPPRSAPVNIGMKTSGIYRIVNTINGKQYIGSSVDVEKRWNVHRCSFRKNKHHSPYLQKSWNKYGEDSFVFEIILDVENKNDLIAWEQIWINALKPEYNVLPTAGSSLGAKHSDKTKARMSAAKRQMSDETKAKMSAAKKGIKRSDDTKAKISVAHKGKTLSDEHRAKMDAAQQKQKIPLKATREDGLIIYFESFRDAMASKYFHKQILESMKNKTHYQGFRWEKVGKKPA